MKKIVFFFSFFFAFQLTTKAQTPCDSGLAGIYPCDNYDLMAHIPIGVLANVNNSAGGSAPEGSDIWGWTDAATGKEYAIAAMTNSTAFVDISDPVNPIFLGRLDSNAGNNYWRDVKIYNNHAFIVADNVGAHGMQIFDLTKLRGITSPPETFTADTVYNNVGSCHNIFINEETAIAYLVGCNTFSGGPNFIDISDPENPVFLNGYANEGYTHDVQVVLYTGPDTAHRGKEIFIGSNATKIVILDVTDKNNVQKISEITYSQRGYTHQGWFTEDQRYFILGDETDEQNFGMNTRTLIFDFNDLENPVLSSTHSGETTAIDHNGYVKGNEFFMANYRAGLQVFDISNIGSGNDATSMTKTGFFDTYPANNTTGFNGAWSVYPYFESGNIIINDIDRGLFIVRKSGTLSSNSQELNDAFSLFPNPADGLVTIQSSENFIIKTIEVYTLLGQKVLEQQNINQSKYVLDKNTLQSGMYFVRINKSKLKKVVFK
jgi:choice-of-anchor B domain-containing protein